MSEMTHRADPAPSRLRYRLHRLWLTPFFRTLVRFGLPFGILIAALVAIWTTDTTRFAIQGWVADVRRSIEERPEFMVHAMAIDGASEAIAQDIREIAPVDFPLSSFHLDLDGMKARIAELDAVARADLRVRTGGVLQVDIVERLPAVVWRVGHRWCLCWRRSERNPQRRERGHPPRLPRRKPTNPAASAAAGRSPTMPSRTACSARPDGRCLRKTERQRGESRGRG